MQVGQALALAKARGVDRLDAQLLLAWRLRRPRSWLLAHDDHELEPRLERAYFADLAQRAAGTPLAFLLGEREFHGLRLKVTPAVLVPRPETELLVDWALELLEQMNLHRPRVVDLGTGSGAIALAIKFRWTTAQVAATDLDTAALEVARHNVRDLGLQIELAAGHWWRAVPVGHFDLVVSNPPYIAADDPHLASLTAEPRHALTPGGDGLDALREIIAAAPDHLRDRSWLLLEHGWDQAGAVRTLLAAAGFESITTRRDLAGHERCTGGRWRPPPS